MKSVILCHSNLIPIVCNVACFPLICYICSVFLTLILIEKAAQKAKSFFSTDEFNRKSFQRIQKKDSLKQYLTAIFYGHPYIFICVVFSRDVFTETISYGCPQFSPQVEGRKISIMYIFISGYSVKLQEVTVCGDGIGKKGMYFSLLIHFSAKTIKKRKLSTIYVGWCCAALGAINDDQQYTLQNQYISWN